MSIVVNYEKRKNTNLFQDLEIHSDIKLTNVQNYCPIYNKFFILTENNCNNINLNNDLYLHKVLKTPAENKMYSCILKNNDPKKDKNETKNVFFKMAPLLDPFKYILGKYETNSTEHLPAFNDLNASVHPKLLDANNCAYVDGFFTFLTSKLLHSHDFTHGIDFYGSYLGIKNDFILDISDDIEYLMQSAFFNKNKDTLFTITDFSHVIDSPKKLKPIKISSFASNISIHSIEENDMFKSIDLNELKEMSLDLIDLTNSDMVITSAHKSSLISTTTCSSRTSHTDIDVNDEEECKDGEEGKEECKDGEDDKEGKDGEDGEDGEDDKEGKDGEDGEDGEDDDWESEPDYGVLEATIPKLPVQVIAMEYCDDTFDDLILNSKLTTDEWHSSLMQIIMILITYQKAFAFTHNDLHTNNVMYNQTTDKYIYYRFNNIYYRVPTFGRIFKIIDFGRSIYKFNKNLFVSDSFKHQGDAFTQYNTEPYFNDKKPRLDPNFSFDLCRLACSIFDYVVDDFDNLKSASEQSPIAKLIIEWCTDDNNINVLYKNNGDERYPEFKLYKMISRFVHNHTPTNQLNRPEFQQFIVTKPKKIKKIINIDDIPSYIK